MRQIHKCENGEEMVNAEYFNHAQTLHEIDELIEIKKDFQNSCQMVRLRVKELSMDNKSYFIVR